MTHPFSEPYSALGNIGPRQGGAPVALDDIGNVIQRVAGLQALIESFGFDRVATEVGADIQRVRQDIATRGIAIPRHIAALLDELEGNITAHTNAFAAAASAT